MHADNASAASVISPGSTATISIDPVLPENDAPFTVNVTGKWRDSCIPDQGELTYEIREFMEVARPELKQVSIKLKTSLVDSTQCEGEFEPTPFELSVLVDNSDWDVIYATVDIVESPNSDRHIIWQRSFDLVLGLHEIPPRLGAGYWISEDTPFQGLLVQQQGNTAVFYELQYNRISGEPNWYYANGNFYGDSLKGVAYLVNWMSPVEGATLGLKNNPDLQPLELPYFRLVQPEDHELSFVASSAGINVRGVNRISAFVGLHEVDGEPQPVYHDYRRWVFASDETQPPPVVPDMIGSWELYGFSGQDLMQQHQIQFGAGSSIGTDLYRFSSAEDKWILNCQINIKGEGDCTLANSDLGLTINYYMDKIPSDPTLGYFNGNYAKAPLVNSDINIADQTGVLLRSGVRLPVLELQ